MWSRVVWYIIFRGASCVHEKQAVASLDTLLLIYQTVRGRVSEGSNLHCFFFFTETIPPLEFTFFFLNEMVNCKYSFWESSTDGRIQGSWITKINNPSAWSLFSASNKLRPSANHIRTDGQSVSWSWHGTATGPKWVCIIYNDSLQYSQRTRYASISKTNNVSVLLYREIVAICQNIKKKK